MRVLPLSILFSIVLVSFSGCNQASEKSDDAPGRAVTVTGESIGMPVEDTGLPAPVIAAWKSAFPGIKVSSISTTTTDEGTVHYLTNTGGEINYTLEVTPAGEIVKAQTEVVITADELPEAATAAMQEAYPGKEITDTYKFQINGEARYYANVLLKEEAGTVHKKGFRFDQDGNILKQSDVTHSADGKFLSSLAF